jgi:catechol 2,3-dioxygenase-like lactoylglutathione lyase family enzyme
MRLTGIHHSSIVVTDMERARHFYRDILGLKEVERPANFTTPVAWFGVGDEHVHLIPSPHPDTQSPRHFALHVADARAARVHLRAHSIEVQETVPIPGADRFFIRDPDGNQIELIQWSKRWEGNSR